MAHAGRGCPTANYSRFDNRDTQSLARAFRRACSPDNAGADYDRVVRLCTHLLKATTGTLLKRFVIFVPLCGNARGKGIAFVDDEI
jgi:hypothetical protein